MIRTRITLAVLAAGFTLFAIVTLIALEGHEVVLLRTFDAQGKVRTTRTWVADAEGDMWIEAANPDRPFLQQVRVNPEVELWRAGGTHRCHATVASNPDGHRRIRYLLAAKYTWADRWIGLLTDTSSSLAVRLQCR